MAKKSEKQAPEDKTVGMIGAADRGPNWRDNVVPLAVLGGVFGVMVCLILGSIVVVGGVSIAQGINLFATSPFEGDSATLEYPVGGVDLIYPADWVADYSAGQVTLAESQDAIDSLDWNSGPLMVIMAGSTSDLLYEFGGGAATAEGLMDEITGYDWFAETGDRETRRFDNQQGLGVQITVPEEAGGRGYLATFSDGEAAAIVIALCREGEWEESWPIFDAIMDNMAFYPPRASAERGDLAPDQTQSAALDPGGADAWYYESDGDEYVSVIVTAVDDWDPTLEAFDEDGASIGYNDDSNYLDPALVGLHLEEPGEYEFRVAAYSGYGLYEIRLAQADEPGGGSLEYGDTVQGSLDWPGEREEWRFDGEAGDVISVSMIGLGSFGDTYLELYGPDGRELTRNDDGGGGLSSLIDGYVLPEDGEYLIIARAYSNEIGLYELALFTLTTTPLTYGRSVDGELTEHTPREYWSFGGEAGDTITITLDGEQGLVDMALELYGPDNVFLTQAGGDYGSSAQIFAYVLAEDADYRIVVSTSSDSTGSYELLVGPADIREQEIAYGETMESELTEEMPREFWTFRGRGGDTVTISMEGLESFNDTYLELYGPDGDLLIQNDDGGQGFFALIDDYELPESGDYRIVARGYYDAIGPYQLSLTVGQ